MNPLRTHLWRITLVASGVLLAVGGPMHPESDARDSLREELATMTADERWVPGHSIIVVSTLLLATGLWLAWRDRVWPERVQRTLGLAATAGHVRLGLPGITTAQTDALAVDTVGYGSASHPEGSAIPTGTMPPAAGSFERKALD